MAPVGYLLRCTVSGGLEHFARAEVSEQVIVGGAAGEVQVTWHHKGHSGSLLDIRCAEDVSRDIFLQEILVRVLRLRFVDHVSMLVLSSSIPSNLDVDGELVDWITESCLQKQQSEELLDTAMAGWKIWKPLLDESMVAHELEGELIPTPLEVDIRQDRAVSAVETETFRVNTIYTQPAVASVVVSTFMRLVQQELSTNNSSNNGVIFWIDAGAGAGALLRELPDECSIGIDLDPRDDRIKKRDFLQVTRDWIQQTHSTFSSKDTICIISNPPFVEGTRGDYTIVAKFLEHARTELQAKFMGLIVPAKFAHAWKTAFQLPIRLAYRMLLPKNSFYDPSSGEPRNLQCCLLVFDLQPDRQGMRPPQTRTEHDKESIHVVAQRDKGKFPGISTADFTAAVVHGLGRAGVPLGSSKASCMTLKAKLGNKLELFLELNPKRPLSLANSLSNRVETHSLGWMAKSVKPPVALAMHCLVQLGRAPDCATRPGNESLQLPRDNDNPLIVNLMCGEGTLEYESMQDAVASPSGFLIVGDKDPEALQQVANQLSSLQSSSSQRPVMDFVVWDAQNLPLRRGIADVVLGDLPFAGSVKKKHQAATASSSETPQSVALSYPRVLSSTTQVLVPSSGRTVFVSVDAKALTHAAWRFAGHLGEQWQTKININGLAGKMLLLGRKGRSWKDVNLLVAVSGGDHSTTLCNRARDVCSRFHLNKLQELKELEVTDGAGQGELLDGIELRDEYCHADGTISHCYRLWFDPILTNSQAKVLEKAFRLDLEETPVLGMRLA